MSRWFVGSSSSSRSGSETIARASSTRRFIPDESDLEAHARAQLHLGQNPLDRCSAFQAVSWSFLAVASKPLSDHIVNRARQILRALPAAADETVVPGSKRNWPPSGSTCPLKNSQQRRLARAIAAQQTNPLPRFDLARDSIQQRRPAKSDPQVFDGHQVHEAVAIP